MTFNDLIISDTERLTRYFKKLFQVLAEELQETKIQNSVIKTYDIGEAPTWFHSFVDHIKPDMIANIYSFFDFWLQTICKFHKKQNNLALGHKDIKGPNDLAVYHKYLTKYVNLDLSNTDAHYQHMNLMRRVRNILVHNGGHVPQELDELKKLENIDGIEAIFGLIHIKDSYVWESLEHAKQYLLATVPPID